MGVARPSHIIHFRLGFSLNIQRTWVPPWLWKPYIYIYIQWCGPVFRSFIMLQDRHLEPSFYRVSQAHDRDMDDSSTTKMFVSFWNVQSVGCWILMKEQTTRSLHDHPWKYVVWFDLIFGFDNCAKNQEEMGLLDLIWLNCKDLTSFSSLLDDGSGGTSHNECN